MTNKLLFKLSIQSLKARKQIIFPYIIASILLFAMQFVMISLIENEYIQTRHEVLPLLMGIASVICTIFTVIFVLYANKFSRKNQYKEFAIYSVLGLEKKHLKKMISTEHLISYLIITPFSIILGYLFGIIGFIFINKLMKDSGATMMNYPFSIRAMVLCLITISMTLFLAKFLSNRSIKKRSIRELFAKEKTFEKEPKSRYFISLIALISLGIGYYISMTTKGIMEAIPNLFIAVLLVMVATYLLFITCSILLLKTLKSRKKYYYQAKNFLSTSGMMYRMKSNALSLASISILCTGLIITMGTTASVYFSLNDKVDSIFSRDYAIANIRSEEKVHQILDDINKNVGAKNIQIQKTFSVPAQRIEQNFDVLSNPEDNKNIDISNICYITVEPLSSYNAQQGKTMTLADNEILLATNVKTFSLEEDFTIGDLRFKSSEINGDKELFKMAVDGFYMVANDDVVERLNDFFLIYDDTDGYVKAAYVYDLSLDLKENSPENNEKLANILNNYGVFFETPESMKRMYYSINGGFLSLGIMLSMVMLIGTSLMLYYKQISEGYADKNNFAIMKQVGLEDKVIKKTIKKQILWIFFLPILVAIIHTLFAFNLLKELLILFGMRDSMQLIEIFGTISLFCLIIYGLFYLLTSRVYYKIVR